MTGRQDPRTLNSLIRSQRVKQGKRQARRKVFVVEDNPEQALRLQELITGLGHRIVGTAATVDRAFSRLNRLREMGIVPDLALVDADMTGEVPQRIVVALHARGIPVALASASDLPDALARSRCSHLKKPLDRENFRRLLDGVPEGAPTGGSAVEARQISTRARMRPIA